MIPVTYPSSVSAFNRRQMEIYPITPTASQQAWTDYIPVRFNSSQYIENTTANEGYMAVNVLSSSTGKQAWVDYVPVVIDDNRSDAWQISANGYIPVNYSGTGNGTAANAGLSLNFLGASSLDKRITFSRASNATVTNSSGLIQYAPHNLVTFSEQFDNSTAWSRSNISVTANSTTAPNGTATADNLVPNTASANHRVAQTVTTSTVVEYSASVYAKANGYDFLRLRLDSGAAAIDYCFSLLDGSYASFGSVTGSASAISVGSGWYRLTITGNLNVSGGTTVRHYVEPQSTSSISAFTGDGTSGVLVWGAQLQLNPSSTDYNPTTVKNLLGYSEAFDNAAWTKSNSFIQTNLLTFSEQFDNASWSKSATTVSANAAVSPNGTTTADKLIATSASGVHYAAQVFTAADNTSYTFSYYAKAGEYNQAQLNTRNKAGQFRSVIVSLIDGSNITTPTAGLTVVTTSVGDGWFRISGAFDTGTGATTPSVYIYPVTGGSAAFTGDDTSGIFIWGAQLVQGSVAGDYQQTTSTALPVMYQAPNGTMTADKLVEDTAAAQHNTYTAIFTGTGFTQVYSVYAKAGERKLLTLGDNTSGSTSVYDLELGTVISSGTDRTASITSVGSGWYRCSNTGSLSGSQRVYIGMRATAGNGTYTGNGTSGIYIWGAQLSDSASLDQYVNNPVAAPSSTAYYGARFDYDPVTLQPRGLLIEEQRSNLLLQSEDFATTWTNSATTDTANTVISPDGTQDADTITASAGAAVHSIAQSFTFSNISYAYSVYAKAGTNNYIQLRFGAPAGAAHCNFDLTAGAGAVGTSSGAVGTITNVGNGWYRCSVVVTTLAASSAVTILLVTSASAAGAESWTATGTETVYLWGAQLEAGAFPTSYIPTTTAQVTRSADVAVVQGSNFSSWYNPNTSTIFTNISVPFDASSIPVGFTPTTGDFNNSAYITAVPTADNLSVLVGGVSQVNISVSATGARKIAATLALNDFALCSNGGSVGTDTSGTFASFNRLTIGCSPWNTDNQLNGYIRQVAYYPRRLQNSELVSITS